MVEEMEESTFSIEAAVPEVDESVKEYKIHVSPLSDILVPCGI